MSSNKSLISASAIGLVARVVSIGLRFMSLPIILRVISPERYGLWLIITSIVGWLSMSDLGIPSALQNRLIDLLGMGEKKRADALLSFGLKLLSTIGVSLFVLGILFLFVPVDSWFSVDAELAVEFKVAFILCLLTFALGLPTRIGGVLFNVHGYLSVPIFFELATSIFSFLMLLVAVYFKWDSIVILAICSLVGLLVGSGLSTIIGLFKFDFKLKGHEYSSTDNKLLISKGGFFFLAMIGELLILQSDAFLIGTIKGANFVPVFMIPMTLFINFIQLQNIWLRPLWPLLSNCKSKGMITELKKHLIKTLMGSLLLSLVFGIGILIAGDLFIRFWSNNAAGMPFIMALGIALYVIVACIDNALASFLNAFDKIESRLAYTIFFGIMKVIAGGFVLFYITDGIEYLPLTYALVMLTCSLPFAIFTLVQEWKTWN